MKEEKGPSEERERVIGVILHESCAMITTERNLHYFRIFKYFRKR